jgi:hypothetical protein
VISVAGIELPQLVEHAVGPVTPFGTVMAQVKVDPETVGFKVTGAVLFPEQIVCELVQLTPGTGCTVTVKVLVGPEHPFAEAVTV